MIAYRYAPRCAAVVPTSVFHTFLATLIACGALLLAGGGCPAESALEGGGLDAVLAGDQTEALGDQPDETVDTEDIRGGIPAGGGGGGNAPITPNVSAATMQDESVVLRFTASGPGNRRYTYSIVTPPARGTLSAIRRLSDEEAEVTYTPPESFAGGVQFSFEANDGSQTSKVATASIIVYPIVRFIAEPLDGQRDLTVCARAFTVNGEPLPEGNYVWAFDEVLDAGTLPAYAQACGTFSTAGTHTVKLTVLLAGLSSPFIAAHGVGGFAPQAVASVWPIITGTIRDGSGAPLVDVQVSADGAGTSDTTDSRGYYQIAVPLGWSGRVTPTLEGFSFDPSSRTYVELSADAAEDDFVGQLDGGGASALEAPFTSQPVTVDGTMSPGEWQDAYSYSEDASDLVPPGVVVQGSTTGPSDTSASIHLKHDSNYVYIAVEVTDDTIVPSAPNMWDADVVEIFLDHDNSRTGNIGFNRMQFNVNAGGSVAEGGAVPPGSWNGAASSHANGFVVEYRILKSALGLAETGTYGFDIAISDVEPIAGNFESRYWYFATAPAETNETLWGDIILLDGGGPTGGILAVSPSEGLTSSGNEGGPFSPDSKQYILTNTGDAAIDWSAAKSQAWLDLSPAGGLLDAGASATVTVSINANANVLSAGIHQDSVTFSNDTNGAGNTPRPVSLTVNATVGVLAVTPSVGLSSSGFEGGPFDPSSITYTLKNVGATAIGYSIAKSAAWLSLNGGDGPLTGSLAPAETLQVAVSINTTANGLSANTYNDSVAFANTTNGLGNTARSVSLNVRAPGSGTPTPVIVASRISGMAPFAVFFEATDSTDSLGRSINSDGLLGNDIVEYTWDFGPGSEGDVGGRYFSGFNGAHVYETPGDYDVVLTVREASGQDSLTLRVTAQAFSGTTYYISAAGNDANNGTSPATAWRTYDKAFWAIENHSIVQPGDRVLFRRGDTFFYTSPIRLGQSVRDVIIAAYDSGPKPLIQYAGTGSGNEHAAITLSRSRNISIVDLSFNTTSTVTNNRVMGFQPFASHNVLFLRVSLRAYADFVAYTNGLFLVDSSFTDSGRNNLFFAGSRLVLFNSTFDTNTNNTIYGECIDRAVVNGSYFANGANNGLRIAANTGHSWNVLVSGNTFEPTGVPIELKVTQPGAPYSGHNILIERNYVRGQILNDNDGYTDVVIRNNIIESPGRGIHLRDDPDGGLGPLGLQGLRIYNNTIKCTGTAAAIQIDTDNHRDIRILNNITEVTSGSASARIISLRYQSGMNQIQSDYNLLHLPNRGSNPLAFEVGASGYTLPQWRIAFGQGGSSFPDDPMFDPSGPTGFELSAGSPARNRGIWLRLVREDYIDAAPWPNPQRPKRSTGRNGDHDIGGFEYESP